MSPARAGHGASAGRAAAPASTPVATVATALVVASAAIGTLTIGPLAGQETWEPPSWVEEAVRAQVADAWAVDPQSVVLEWGELPAHRDVTQRDTAGLSDQVALAGAGIRGAWVARLSAEDGAFGVRVRAGVRAIRPVATLDIERGQTLTAAHIAFEEAVRWGPPQRSTADPAPGWRAERRIARGDVLREPAVRPALTVRTGERVKVVWNRGRISLTLTGVATGSARPGERVGVRLDAGRRLRGVAGTDGVIWIQGG